MNALPPVIFEADNFSVRFGARMRLVDLTLRLRVGEVLTVLGRQDSGRDILRDALMGTLPRTVDKAGALNIAEGDKHGLRLAYIGSPSARALAPHAPAKDQLARAVAGAKELELDDAETELQLAFERLPGAPPVSRLLYAPGELSLRELAFAFLALALAKNPNFVIADEITAGLDPAEASEILDLLSKEQMARRFALICFTGDPVVPLRLGGRIAVLRDGRLVEEGPVQRIAGPQANAYSQSLFRAVPCVGRASESTRPSPRSEPLLQVRSILLEKPAKRGVWAGEGITFDLRRGASLALVGKNGTGRRTLIRAILGLAPIWQGRVVFDAVDMGVLSPDMRARLRQRVAFISGDESVLDARMTAYETVVEPMRAHIAMGHKEMVETAGAMLRRVGLGDMPRNRRVAELSALDRRRIQVARGLAGGPQLVVLFEPLMGLDAPAQGLILDLLKDFRREEGAAFIVITANFAVAEALAEDALVIREREIIERGPIAEILRAPKEAHTAALIAAATIREHPLSQTSPQG
ncbi:MAG: ATP-binding cassette domain-containing protein [Alphaproteobacteria bacterium]